jgi:hypothetical protein
MRMWRYIIMRKINMLNGVRLALSERTTLVINAADTTNLRKDIIHK